MELTDAYDVKDMLRNMYVVCADISDWYEENIARFIVLVNLNSSFLRLF